MNIRKWLCKSFGSWKWLYKVAGCKRYEQPEPPEPPTPPEPPKPEYVEVKVCKRSELKAQRYCLFTEMRKFVKGKEPKRNCDFHPVPKFKKKRRELRFGGWMFFDFLANVWDDAKYEETCERHLAVLLEFRKRGYSVNECFLWLSSGKAEHKHLNWKIPWMTRGMGAAKKVMLNVFNPKYFRLLKVFIELHKLADIELEGCLFMAGVYNDIPFQRNVNGIKRFTSPEALPFQKAFAKKVCQTYLEVYGHNKKTRIKILNEGQHGGSTSAFHWLGEFHRDIAEVLLKHITISKIKVDVSHSEGCQIHLNEPLPCGKCGQIHGDIRFNRSNPNNSILCESHQNSILANLIGTEKLNFHGSKWARYELSGDCGAGQKTKGYRIPGTNFYQGNVDETYKMNKYAFQRTKERGKKIIISLWTFEIFIYKTKDNNDWREFYGMTNILWDRVDAQVRALEEVYGG